MTLHWAEAIAGELIAWTLAGHVLVRAWRKWKAAGRKVDELARLEDDEE